MRFLPERLRRFARDRRGATAIMVGLLSVPGFMAIGVAVDLGRAQVAKMRLTSALDSAALAIGAAVGLDEEGQYALAQSYIDANFPIALGRVVDFDIGGDEEAGTITITAEAVVETTFMKMFNVGELNIGGGIEARTAESALMVSLVLDVTGSMWSSNNISSLRTSAKNLVGILYGEESLNDNLLISVVPYAASVNLGTRADGVVEAGHSFGAPGSTDLLGWKGCVVERAVETLDDTPPAAGKYWSVYRYPVALDNAWIEGDSISVEPGGTSNSNGFRGPNLGCPDPIVPLTSNRTTVDGALDNLTAWNRGGTLTDIGVAWGIRVLSPGAPFTESAAIDPQTEEPLWTSFRWRKAMVVMTDGDSQFFKLSGDTNPTNQPPPSDGRTRPKNKKLATAHTDYTGYGRLGDPLATTIFGTTNSGTAKNKMSARIEGLCTAAKAQGIIVYSVVFTSGVNATVRDMYQRCASDPGKYWYAPTQDALANAFEQIGEDLVRLHISR